MLRKTLLILTALIIGIAAGWGQTPDWENCVLTNITDTELAKDLNQGSIFIDENDCIHVVYHQIRDAGQRDMVLFYTMRDILNRWSEPELIQDAGLNFNRPNIIINPATGNVEVFGTINGRLHRIVRDEEEGWTGNPIATPNAIHEINLSLDALGNVHIAGVSYDGDNNEKIIYLTNFNNEWESSIIRETVPFSHLSMVRPAIAVAGAGSVVIGYIGRGENGTDMCVVQNLEPAGDVWRHQVLETPNDAVQFFNLVIDDDDIIHLIYTGQLFWPGPFNVHYQRKHIEARTWSQPELINRDNCTVPTSMVIDESGNIHIVGHEMSISVPTGNLNYITNANEEEEWEVSNPFSDFFWEKPLLKLDSRDEFQMVVLRRWNINYEVSHKGVPMEVEVPVPENLSGEAINDSIVLKWDRLVPEEPNTPELLGYNIYRCYDEEIDFQRINAEIITDTTYTDSSLVAGIYDYFITAGYAFDIESNPSDTIRVVIKEKLPKPTFEPDPGEYSHVVNVTISCSEGIGIIHFTLDESEPDEDSPVFVDYIIVDDSLTIKARSYHQDYLPSDISKAVYNIQIVSADRQEDIIYATELFAPYPNPFNPYTSISYRVGSHTNVIIELFDIKGRKVTTLLNEKHAPGHYSTVWDGRNRDNQPVPSGLYFFRLSTEDKIEIRKAVLIK